MPTADFTADAAERLGAHLRAIYTFGTEHSRLLVLVDALSLDLLDTLAPLVRTARAAGMPVRIDAEMNLLRGSDAFPDLTLELISSRRLIHGSDVLDGLTVDPTSLRLHVEHGLRDVQGRLVRLVLARAAGELNVRKLRRVTRRLLLLLEGAVVAAGYPPTTSGGLDEIARRAPEVLMSVREVDLPGLVSFVRGGGGPEAVMEELFGLLPPLIYQVDHLYEPDC